jgi:Tol biopolymer transport system component/tRNA A-37 threonylcarbamoyl transferase component Bud32
VAEAIAGRLTAALADRYAIERQVGQGGMATVYLARDLRHDRKVALKVLRPELAAVIGADRFLQEIRVTAGLQHPHILPLHDSGEAGTFLFYVMPFVDGESLRDRLERERQLPIDDAIRIATEAASALAYAHGRGVIHRDVKPENILIAHGSAVVADFGIARAVTEAGGGRLTETGLSLGTPQYMSPEQATADRELDGRSDVYALGAVLYEMLTGEPPYTGPTTQSVIAKLLTETPRPVLAGRPTVPPHVAAAVHRALARLPADRFRGAREFAEALVRPDLAQTAETARSAVAAPAQPAGVPRRLVAAIAGVAVVALAVAGWSLIRLGAAPAVPVVRSILTLPDEARANAFQGGAPLALSPDGNVLVYAGTLQLYVRRLDQLVPVALPYSQNGFQPFFSPDGEHVGFVADGNLKRVALAGGAATTICPVQGFGGASWGPDDTIVFSASGRLFQVPAGSGTPRAIPVPDSTRSYRWPDVLPDGRRVLATSGKQAGAVETLGTVVVDLATGQTTPIPGSGVSAKWIESGALLSYDPAGAGVVIPFDLRSGRATGPPTPVLEGVIIGLQGSAKIGVSRNGWVVYMMAATTQRRLTFVNRHGKVTSISSEAKPFSDPRFSPSGNSVVVTVIGAGAGLRGNLWLLDAAQGTLSRLTFGGEEQFPDWSADGRRVTFADLSPEHGFRWLPASGGESEPLLEKPGGPVFEGVLSRDGKSVVYRLGGIPGDLYYMRRDSLGKAHPLLTSAFDERAPALAPNDKWLAYVSNETGRDEVYVRPFPHGGARWLVSAAGGTEPRWGRDGRELFYRSADSVFAVQVRTDPDFTSGRRSLLFTGNYLTNYRHATYDVHPDGQRFVFVTGESGDASELILVQNILSPVARGRGRSR